MLIAPWREYRLYGHCNQNATIYTGEPGRTLLHEAPIAIDGDKIMEVGSTSEIGVEHPNAEQVEGVGKAIFPGLVNCHTHLLPTLDRGIQKDFGFPSPLRFPVTARSLITPEKQQVMAVLGALEAILSETTCLLEISGRVQGYAESLKQPGLRLVLTDRINDVNEAKVHDGLFEFSTYRLDQGGGRAPA